MTSERGLILKGFGSCAAEPRVRAADDGARATIAVQYRRSMWPVKPSQIPRRLAITCGPWVKGRTANVLG
jgi:hypothetical protein